MTTRRRRGEDGISFEHRGPCSDPHRHRHCPGLWRGELTVGYTGDGKRQRRKVSGKTKAAVVDKLRDLHTQLDKGVTPKAGYAYYTVRQAAEDWLAHGLDGRSPKTITKNQNVLEPILTVIGARKLRDLSAADVRQALAAMAAGYSTAARTLPVMELRPGLKDVRRPAELMHAYIVLSLLTGIRTEEARALRWAHVDLDGDPAASPPVPPHVAVWRSVRTHGETKTERSRRTLGLPATAVQALRTLRESQAGERLAAGDGWQHTGLVFTNYLGAALDAGNVRKMFKRVCTEAGIGDGWTPRELRTSFVSLLSHQGVSIEEIARLAEHASTRTTELVYRRELRPVITTGAESMDQLFTGT